MKQDGVLGSAPVVLPSPPVVSSEFSASGTATSPGPPSSSIAKGPLAKLKKKKSLFSLNGTSNSTSNSNVPSTSTSAYVSNANNSSTTSGFAKLRGKSFTGHHNTNNGSTASRTPNNNNSEHSGGSSTGGFFRRVSALFSKIRAISDEVFASDEILEELFSDSGSSKYKRWESYPLETVPRDSTIKPPASAARQQMYELSSASSSGRGTTLNEATIKSLELESIIEDILKQHQRIVPTEEGERDDGIRTLVEFSDSASEGPLLDVYDVDFAQLREELTRRLGKDNSQVNVGELIWEYRKAKWLVPTKTTAEIESHVASHALRHVPRESYAKIYNQLVVRHNPLRKGKSINLSDLVTIIDAGWVAEEKYERASRGLP